MHTNSLNYALDVLTVIWDLGWQSYTEYRTLYSQSQISRLKNNNNSLSSNSCLIHDLMGGWNWREKENSAVFIQLVPLQLQQLFLSYDLQSSIFSPKLLRSVINSFIFQQGKVSSCKYVYTCIRHCALKRGFKLIRPWHIDFTATCH